MIRLSGVSYLNAQPLYADLDARFALDMAVPSEVARAVAEDDATLGLIPVAAAATMGDIRFVRDVAIGSRGPVRSVAIFSERPLDSLEEIALDLSSRTSVVLAKLLLGRHGLRPRLLGLSAERAVREIQGKRGALVIGDRALELEGRFPHAFDLGAAWQEWTGLPFVFAAWCGRPGAIDAEDEDRLVASKHAGVARSDEIADAWAQKKGVDGAPLRRYLRDAIRYDLGDEERAGLQRFFDEAASAGLLPRAQARFFGDDAAARRISLPSLDTLLGRAADGERLSAAEGERLISEASLFDLGAAADAVRLRKHPDGVVTYIVDRNVNYTNVCTTSCRFCAFYRPVGHPEGYVLSRDQLREKLQTVVDAGGVQILLQGGLNPGLRIDWYEDLFRWMKQEFKLGLHALSPEEILFLSRMETLTVEEVLRRLHAAGLDSVPGGGAEILVDRVRRKIAKAKCTSEEWLGVMRTAHQMGLRSSATMMYGTVDGARDRIQHLVKIRDLQDETGGFTAFFCWDYQHEKGTRIAAGEHGTHLYLRQQAVARLMLDNVAHVGASWVTQGPAVGQMALRFGADDFGSVMFEENVVSSAGTTFCIDAEQVERSIRGAGFRPVRRNVRYEWLGAPG